MQTFINSFVVVMTAASIAWGGEPIKPAEELAELPARWRELMTEFEVPGMAVVVVRGDEVILLEGLGLRNVERREPVTPDTYFYIASCTKSYVATAVMQLVEEGKISPDAPVKRYLPRFQLADEEYTNTISIRDLLSHAKGINSRPIVVLDAYTGEITEDRYYHFLKEAKVKGSFDYSNVHYTLLGRVIEAVSGMPWREFLRERLFEPAGMTRTTGYASKMYGDDNAALPYDIADGEFTPAAVVKTDRTMHAAGGLGTTARDLGRWLRLNLNGGVIDGKRILSKEHIKEMQTLQAGSGVQPGPLPHLKREGYGLGWTVGTIQAERHIQHGGGYVGTAANVSMLPEHDLGVAVVANMSGRGHVLAEVVLADVYERLVPVSQTHCLERAQKYVERVQKREKEEKPDSRPNPATGDGLSRPPKAYVGSYTNDLLGTVRIDLNGGKLTGSLGDLPFQFFTTTTDRFDAVTGSGSSSPGWFKCSDAGRVEAVIIGLGENDAAVRFERQSER